MTDGLKVAGAICLRTWRATARRPVTLSFSLLQPLIWILFFGFLFQRYDVRSLTRGGRYLDFLVPGVCAMTVLFGASQSGIGLIRDLQSGFLKRILASPASVLAVLGGKLVADVVRLVAQALLLLLVARALGATVVLTPGSVLSTVAFLGVFAASHASLSCMVALWTRAQESMATFVHLVNMPLLFTSSALVPVRHMPDWLASLSQGNPLTLAVDGCRRALLRGEPLTLGRSFAVLALLATVMFAVAALSARRVRRVG